MESESQNTTEVIFELLEDIAPACQLIATHMQAIESKLNLIIVTEQDRQKMRRMTEIVFKYGVCLGLDHFFTMISNYNDTMHASRSYRRPEWGMFLRAESFYNVATMEEEYARRSRAASREYHKKSHGESFLQTLKDNFQPDGLFFLDEPEAALSTQNQMALLIMLVLLCIG